MGVPRARVESARDDEKLRAVIVERGHDDALEGRLVRADA